MVRSVPELGEDFHHLVLTVELRHGSVVGSVRLITFNAGRYHAIGWKHATAPNLLGQKLAVDGHGDGAAKLQIVPGFFFEIDEKILNPEIGDHMDLGSESRLRSASCSTGS